MGLSFFFFRVPFSSLILQIHAINNFTVHVKSVITFVIKTHISNMDFFLITLKKMLLKIWCQNFFFIISNLRICLESGYFLYIFFLKYCR